MAASVPCVLVTGERAGVRLQLRIDRNGDRYHQVVEAVSKTATIPLLCSIDRDERDDWPPSPPLQQLLIEERPTGPVALLVGMAGKSHWSASIECRNSHPSFHFDVACRIQRRPVRLGSSYRILAAPASLSDDCLTVPAYESVLLIRANGSDPEHASRVEMTVPDAVVISCCRHSEAPATVRWKYDFVLLDTAGRQGSKDRSGIGRPPAV
jgi:hypothetical protein